MLYTFPPSDRSRQPFFLFFIIVFIFFSCKELPEPARCGEPAAAVPFHSTLPTAALLRDPCLIPHLMLLRHLISTLSQKQPRSASQTDAIVWIFSLLLFFFVCLFAKLVALSVPTLASFSVSMESSIGSTDGCITYRQMSTVIADWPLIHVLDTVFWEERGGDCTTAITFSGWKSMC